MSSFTPRLFQVLFPRLAECIGRRRVARNAQLAIRRRQSRYVRPRLEGLEDRLAPATFTFTGEDPDNPNAWSSGKNWKDEDGDQGVPGQFDSAIIGQQFTVVVDQAVTVGDVDVQGTLNITHNLTVAANHTLGRQLSGSLGIEAGASATVAKNITLTANNLGVSGTLTDNSTIDVVATSSSDGVTTVGGTLTIGSSDSSANATMDTVALTVSGGGTVTIGGPNGGSSGSVTATGAVTVGGTLNVGDPSSGTDGSLDASSSSASVSVVGPGILNVGGVGGSIGILEVYSLITMGGSPTIPDFVINTKGFVDVKHDASLSGVDTIQGELQADNIDANTGAGITISGAATVIGGDATYNLNGEINASFTFTPTSSVTLGTGATIGGGTYNLAGPLAVNEPLTVSEAQWNLQAFDGSTSGSIGGSGSIKWYNNEFDWEGGTIGGLTGGGFTIEGQADFLTTGSATDFLTTTLTNIGPSTVDFGGTGGLSITGSGQLINDAPYVVPMELSMPSVFGSAPGMFINNGFLNITPNPDSPGSGVTISAPLDNTASGVIDGETGAGPLTLSDTSGTSILDGSIDIKGTTTLSGDYTTTGDLTMDTGGGLTLTGTLSIAGGAGADLGNVILTTAGPFGPGGTISGEGELSTTGYFEWINGTVSVSTMTVGTSSILYLMGSGEFTGTMSVEGIAEWQDGSANTFASGDTVTVEDGAQFLFQNSLGGSITTFDNDGTLELDAGDVLTVNTFTQSSHGTLQSDIGSASSYGVLDVTGAATLDGALDGNLVNGYQPPTNTVFDVLNFGSSSGQFATVNPQSWNAQYNSNSVDLISS